MSSAAAAATRTTRTVQPALVDTLACAMGNFFFASHIESGGRPTLQERVHFYTANFFKPLNPEEPTEFPPTLSFSAEKKKLGYLRATQIVEEPSSDEAANTTIELHMALSSDFDSAETILRDVAKSMNDLFRSGIPDFPEVSSIRAFRICVFEWASPLLTAPRAPEHLQWNNTSQHNEGSEIIYTFEAMPIRA